MRRRSRSSASLEDQVVLITGAASGIGAGLAVALAGRGARLLLCDVDEAGLAATAGRVDGARSRPSPEPRVLTQVADVRDLAALEALVARGVESFGGIDVVVANAGIAGSGSVLNVDPEAFRRVVEVNLLGVFYTVRAALRSVIERRGYVLVVSSLAAFTVAPGMSSYHASKAGAESFANALRLEVTHLGVDVGSAHMAWIDTPMVQDFKAEVGGFERMVAALPPPLNRTTDLDTCVAAFVTGIEDRRRRVWVPGWVGAISAARSLVATALVERRTLRDVPEILDAIDAEVAAKGSSLSSRTDRIARGEGPR